MGRTKQGANPFREKGVALIYVLLIVSVIILMATEMLTQLRLNTDKNRVFLERTQARHYAMGAEQYVALLLEQDFQEDTKSQVFVDSLDEQWNIQRPEFNTDQGIIDIQVVDEQGRFNINSLASKQAAQNLTILKNLLFAQGIEQQVASTITDWIDEDQNTSPGGAEDNFYLIKDTPHRTPDSMAVSISELRSMRDLNKASLKGITPLLTALPESTSININTAPPEVLAAISRQLSLSHITSIVNARDQEPLTTIDDINKIPGLQQKSDIFQAAGIAFSSRYYSAIITATYRDTQFEMKTLLHRDEKGEVTVVGREFGPGDYWIQDEDENETGEDL